jgi:CHAT domain-containing protein/Tfp pilus assembly protein PilF
MNITRPVLIGLISAILYWSVLPLLYAETAPFATTASARKLLNEANAAEKKGDLTQAIRLLEKRLPLLIVLVGENHPDTGEALNQLAYLYYMQGQYAQAEPLSKRSLAINEKALGPDHPDVAFSLNNLARLYESQGQYAQAEPLLKRALSIKEKALGPNHPSVATSLNDLAGLYHTQGQYAQAEPLYKRSLAIKEKSLGPDHPEVATSLNNLALLYDTQGQYTQAEPLYKRSLAIMEKSLGPDHRNVAANLNNLADLYETQGQYAQAEPLYKRSLAITEKALGPDHPDVASSLNGLAGLYHTLGQYAQAEPLLKRSLAIEEKFLGPDHPAVAASLNDLAGLYDTQGQYSLAEPLYKRSLVIKEKSLGPDHPEVATSLNNLALLYDTQGQYTLAEPLYKRSLAIREKALGPDHPAVAVSLNNLALQYYTRGQYSQAEPLYKRSLAIREKALGPGHPAVAYGLNNLALLYETQGQYAQAELLYKRSLTILEKSLGPDHPAVATNLDNLAVLYTTQGQYAQAEPLLLRAQAIAGIAGEPELFWIVQGNLRDFYAKSKPDLAIWYGKKAVNTLQTVRSANTGLAKDSQKSFLKKNEATYKKLADLLFTQGRLMEGQQVLAMLKEAEYFDFNLRDSAKDPRKTQASFDGIEKPLADRYEKISRQLVSLSRERESLSKKALLGLSGEEQSRKDELDSKLSVARKAYDAFMVELEREFYQSESDGRSHDDRIKDFGGKRLASLRALQGTLGELGHGAVTLHYLMTDKRLWILLTTPNIQIKREAAIGEAELNIQIGAYRDAIAQRDPKVKELGKSLYDIIIAPVVDDLKQATAQTLMLSLDGGMRYLPMAALYDGENYLAERYRLVIYTSAATPNLKDSPKVDWNLAGYGMSLAATVGEQSFNALNSVEDELEGIKQDMKGTVMLNPKFTARSLQTGLESGSSVVHIASHFVFKPGNITDSFLLLGDGNPLSLEAIRDYTFKNVDLLTLSACETAVGGGKDANGREVEGFGVQAQDQGAKAVIASLWSVNDHSTGQFMQLFYTFRQKNPGITKAEAMQKTQLAFIEGQVEPALAENRGTVWRADGTKAAAAVTATNHPYYWAPFILMGNWL